MWPFHGLLAVVLLAPLPFASAPGWAWSGLALAIGALLLFWGARILRGREELPPIAWPIIAPVAAPVILVVLWITLQATTLLPGALDHPLWSAAAAALHEQQRGSVSLDRFQTGSALTRLLLYAGVFWLAAHYGQRSANSEHVLNLLAFVGTAYAVYGLFEYFGPNQILGYEKTAYVESLTSTFINRNGYATYCALTLLCTAAILARPMMAAQGAGPRDVLTVKNSLAIAGLIFQCTALYLTGSRAGILSATIGLFTFLLALSFARIGTATERIGIWVTCCVVLLFAFLETGANFIGRLATTTASLEQRQDVWRSTVGLILQRPLTGTGYGTFEDAFRVGRDLSIISVYDKAHNTYLELGLELGIPATCLLVLAVGLIVLASIAGARARDVDKIVCCVAVGASALVAVHSLVDFSLQMPAVAVTFALLLGTAFGQFAAPRRKAKVAPASRSSIGGPGAPLR